MNWFNGDFYWAKQTYNARYWPKNSQLGAVSSVDASIKQYPEKFKEVVQRLELLDEAAVVLAGFGTTTKAWNQVYEAQWCIAMELQEIYTDAMDEQKKSFIGLSMQSIELLDLTTTYTNSVQL